MGGLIPGATYVYERVGDQIFAREIGSQSRIEIGSSGATWTAKQSDLWRNMTHVAKTNPDLRDAIERAIMIYEMGFGNNGQTIDTE